MAPALNPLFRTAPNTTIGPFSFQAVLDVNPEGELNSAHHEPNQDRSDLNVTDESQALTPQQGTPATR